MSTRKKELKLVAILGVAVYAFIFYKYIWVPVIPSISDINMKIESAKQEKASLDLDLKNIDRLRSQMATRNTLNERIDEYLMNSANMVDSLEYVDKLTRLIGNNITELNIAKPEQRNASSINNTLNDDTDLKDTATGINKYYEIKTDFKANMTYQEALDLVKYIEDGTRKVKITKFIVKALTKNEIKTSAVNGSQPVTNNTTDAAKVNQGAQGSVADKDKLYFIDMTVCMYSVNIRASDRLYEYSRHKLSKFLISSSILFGSDTNTQSLPKPTTIGDINEEFGVGDIVIKERSYLAAGENLQVFGVDRENDIARIKTNQYSDVRINLYKDSYSIDIASNENKTKKISGDLPDKNIITLYVGIDMPTIKENQKIRLNIRITNNSDRNINLLLKDTQKRVSVFDRSGRTIYGESSYEKIMII
jgi:hypothetical protein